MVEVPSGTVTFLFTDLEGSTRLWEEHPDAMQSALARHDEILRDAITAHDGYVVKMRGDGTHAAFATAHAAVLAAVDAQRALVTEEWGEQGALKVRAGVHTGPAEQRDGDYFGTAVNRAARLMSVAHGGQIVCSQATADLARDQLDDGAALVDLGEHRLPDLGAPERVYQVVGPDLPGDFPALRSVDSFPGNLPHQVTDFVGRDEELVELAKLLGRSRMVTLTGSGGVGKTRLALQTAAAALPHYEDGAWFVDLAPIDDENFVASEIASTLALPEYRQGSREDALAGALARRHALVVLDNCEHLVDAVARIVELVGHRCPDVTVLATSQEALGVGGEVTFAVRPLDGDEATTLFVERASAARHGFELTADNAVAVDELCRRLDGIPLAIELAAARVAAMSPAAILERVDERFRLLGQGRRTARRRHQTLRAAVDWSYGLLDQQEQTVFARLAVFSGDFTLEAAEAVVADDAIDALDVVDVLTGLVAKSMVTLDDTSGADRYRLYETMRDYGEQRLAEAGDLTRLQERHAGYYLDLAEEAAPHLAGADDLPWSDRIEDEYANVRAALAWMRDNADRDSYTRFVVSLRRYWRNQGLLREGHEWLATAPVTDSAVPARERAECLALAGQSAINLDRYDEGFALVEASRACSAAADEPFSHLTSTTLAMAAVVQGRPDDVLTYCDEAIALARADGDVYALAEVFAQVCGYAMLTVDDPGTVTYVDEAIARARTLGNTYLLATTLQSVGIGMVRVDAVRALALLTESRSVHSGGRSTVTAQSYFWSAIARFSLRDIASAARELEVAIEILHETGQPYQQSMTLGFAASLLSRTDAEFAVGLLALVDRQREDGEFTGAARDVEIQRLLRDRLEERLETERFSAAWAAGRALDVDDAVAETLDALARLADPASPRE